MLVHDATMSAYKQNIRWRLPYKAAAKYQAQDEDEYPGAKDDDVNIQNKILKGNSRHGALEADHPM